MTHHDKYSGNGNDICVRGLSSHETALEARLLIWSILADLEVVCDIGLVRLSAHALGSLRTEELLLDVVLFKFYAA